jgi:hypothetical protein
MPQSAFCTIATRSHLKYAIALGKALDRYHPDLNVCILAVDFTSDSVLPRSKNIELIALDALKFDEIGDMKIYFNAFELSNALKPFLIFHLLQKRFERVVYLDADIFVVGNFKLLFELLDRNEFVLSPHWLYPEVSKDSVLSVANIADLGIYNGGMWGLRRGEGSSRMLQWLMHFLPCFGFDDQENQMWTDQKLLPLLVQLYQSYFGCIEDPGYNIAYWNLHERQVRRENGRYYANDQPVVFFHLSQFPIGAADPFADNRLWTRQIPVVKEMVDEYRSDIPVDPLDRRPYAFDVVGARRLSPELRRYYFQKRTFDGFRETRGWRHALARFRNRGEVDVSG